MRPFLSLYITNLFLVGGTGLLTTYLALYMVQHQVSTFWIGTLTSCYYLGLLLGSKIGYYLISSVGHIRTFAATTAIVLASVAAHGLSNDIQLWLVLRLMVGIGMMCNYMVLESWLNEQTAPEQRGRVFSFYMVTSYLGMMSGQLALSHFPDLGYAPLFLICIALSVGIIPISITRRIHPKPLKPIKVSFFAYFKHIPQSLTAVLFAGIINGSFYGLAPVFASQAGFSSEDIAFYMSVTILAGLLAQWPMGILSDRIRRSILLRANAIGMGVVSLALFVLPINPDYIFALTFVFGIFAFTIYPLSSALANSRVDDEARVGVASALLVAFGLGAGLGSALIAQAMAVLGYKALYGSIVILTVFMFMLLTFINSRQKREKPEVSDYVVSPSDITTSPLAASMDPRIDESLAQEQLLVVEEAEQDEPEQTDIASSDIEGSDIERSEITKEGTLEKSETN